MDMGDADTSSPMNGMDGAGNADMSSATGFFSCDATNVSRSAPMLTVDAYNSGLGVPKWSVDHLAPRSHRLS